MELVVPVELAIAFEAAAHARATAELNPLADAEALEIGAGRACYAGAFSPLNSVFGLGLEDPVEARDIREIERFYERKEKSPSYWVTPATDPSLLALLERRYRPTRVESIYGATLEGTRDLPAPRGTNKTEPELWTLAFTQARDKTKREPDLWALTKLHQQETRFYFRGEGDASYTFFHRGIAWVPFVSTRELLALQWNDAHEFRARALATYAPHFPKLYERTLYELV